MPASPQPESNTPSRRALLAGALGGMGAWAAAAVGRRSPVQATDPNDVVLGAANSATTETSISNTANNNHVLRGYSAGSGFGVFGESDFGIGVAGHSGNGIGVRASSASGYGVYSTSTSSVRPASVGWQDNDGTGLLGYSSSVSTGVLPAPKPKTGVFGFANQDSGARGVWGHSPSGIGIYGVTTTGYAGYFWGKVFSTQFYEMAEIATPGAPGVNKARLFIRDNGAGKTQLCVRFATGSVKLLATEG